VQIRGQGKVLQSLGYRAEKGRGAEAGRTDLQFFCSTADLCCIRIGRTCYDRRGEEPILASILAEKFPEDSRPRGKKAGGGGEGTDRREIR
jgi:hypothetical protein